MLGTGCRIGEVIGLTWDDIDFENATLSINHQIIYKKRTEKFDIMLRHPKMVHQESFHCQMMY